jgi:hypothetical protein
MFGLSVRPKQVNQIEPYARPGRRGLVWPGSWAETLEERSVLGGEADASQSCSPRIPLGEP